MDRVIETAKAVNIPTDQQILHILNQEFIIDGQEDVREPLGMSGVRLEVKVHIVTGAVSAAQNIMKCVRRCGLEVQDLILQPLASAMAVLSEDEKDLGVRLVDIGGGTTDIAVFTQGAIRHTAVIPIAGDQITNDIAMALAHADQGRRGDQAPLRLRSARARRSQRHGRGAGRGRPRAAPALAADAGRGDRAARGGAVLADPGRAAPQRLRGAAVLGHRHHRRQQRACRAWWSWARRSSTCRCGWARRTMRGSLAEVVRNPRYSTVVGLLVAGLSAYQRQQIVRMHSASFKQVFERMKIWIQGISNADMQRRRHVVLGSINLIEEENGMFELVDTLPQEAVIKVVGVGGCGGNAVDHMIDVGRAWAWSSSAPIPTRRRCRATAPRPCCSSAPT